MTTRKLYSGIFLFVFMFSAAFGAAIFDSPETVAAPCGKCTCICSVGGVGQFSLGYCRPKCNPPSCIDRCIYPT
ncbi:MAG: hypothetical protein AB1752_02350 [Candidatus Zixiibacteriota bacterium]